MDDEQHNEQEEDVDNSITLENFMEQFTDYGGTIVDLFEYLKADDEPELDVKLLTFLWDWLTVDGLEVLDHEYHSNVETRRLLNRIAKNITSLNE